MLAAQYIERHHAVPPVLFHDLLQLEMESSLRKAVDILLEKKKNTTEGEYTPRIPVIQKFIRDELPKQKVICDAMPDDGNRDWSALNSCFADVVGFEIRRYE